MNDQKRQGKYIIYGLALLIPVFIGRIQELVPMLGDLHLAKIAIACAFLLFLLAPSENRNGFSAIMSVPQGKYVLYIIALGFVSVSYSIWQGGSMGFMTDFMKNIFFIYLLIACTNSDGDVKTIVRMLIVSALVLVGYSILNPKVVEAGRVYVTGTYDPNDFALFLAMTLPLTFFLMEQESRLWKLFLLMVICLIMFAILKTGSRGGLLSLMTVVFLVLLKKGLKFTIKISPLILIVFLILVMNVGESFWDRFATILEPSTDYNTSASVGRVEVWKRGLEVMFENPVLGTGAGTFSMAEGSKHDGGKWSAAHNSFIQIGAELGFTGLIFFMLMLYHAITFVKKHDAGIPWLQQGLVTGLYGFCVGGMFLSWAYWPALYFFIGLTVIYGKLYHTRLKTLQQTGNADGC